MPSLISPDEWSARTSVTVNPPWSVVPPAFMGSNFCKPLAASHMQRSKLVMTGAPVADAMSSVSPTWSPWPCVSTMWVTPLMAAALSDTKAGLPVKNGSISTALPAKSSRKAEWPYQVICILVLLGWRQVGLVGGKIRHATARSMFPLPSARLDLAILLSLPSPPCGVGEGTDAGDEQAQHQLIGTPTTTKHARLHPRPDGFA